MLVRSGDKIAGKKCSRVRGELFMWDIYIYFSFVRTLGFLGGAGKAACEVKSFSQLLLTVVIIVFHL